MWKVRRRQTKSVVFMSERNLRDIKTLGEGHGDLPSQPKTSLVGGTVSRGARVGEKNLLHREGGESSRDPERGSSSERGDVRHKPAAMTEGLRGGMTNIPVQCKKNNKT